MPKDCVYCLACCKKGLTLADARSPHLNRIDYGIKRVMVDIQVTISKRLDLWNETGMLMFVMEGMLEE